MYKKKDLFFRYTALVEKLLYTECGLGVAEAEVNRFKYALVLLRQFQALLTVLQSDAAACANRIAALDQDLLGNLTELGLAMADKGGDSRRRLQTHLLQVPRDRVCPQFARLAKTWQGFQEEAVVLSKVNAMREALHKHIAHLKQLPLKVGIEPAAFCYPNNYAFNTRLAHDDQIRSE